MKEFKGVLDKPESARVWEDFFSREGDFYTSEDFFTSVLKCKDLVKSGYIDFTLYYLELEDAVGKVSEVLLPKFFYDFKSLEQVPEAFKDDEVWEGIIPNIKDFYVFADFREIDLGTLIGVEFPEVPGKKITLYFKGEYKGEVPLTYTLRVVVPPKYASVKALIKKALSGEVVKIKDFTKDTVTYKY